MQEGCHSCNFWYHERTLYRKIILFFSPQLHTTQMNIAWIRLREKKRLLDYTNWETLVFDSREQMKYWKTIAFCFSYKDQNKQRKTHIWSSVLQVLKFLVFITPRNGQLPKKLTSFSFVVRKQIWTSHGSNTAKSPSHETAVWPKPTPAGLHERSSSCQWCRATPPCAWDKLFGLPPLSCL